MDVLIRGGHVVPGDTRPEIPRGDVREGLRT